jgi:SAM-dependent methyltransferase
MSFQHTYYPESKFGGFTSIDGTIAFFIRVNSLVKSSSVVLDVGCGRGASVEDPVSLRRELRVLKGKCAKVIGIDVDIRAKDNPFIDEFQIVEGNSWPVESNSIDVMICDFVLEHIEDPNMFFCECQRVVKPGGYICIRTPNAWSYIALFARLIPNKLHASVLGKVQDRRKEEDVFPTLYRSNTKKKIRCLFNKYGFEGYVFRHEAEPSYLSFSRHAYLLGVIHQRFALNMFKSMIFAFGQKKV